MPDGDVVPVVPNHPPFVDPPVEPGERSGEHDVGASRCRARRSGVLQMPRPNRHLDGETLLPDKVRLPDKVNAPPRSLRPDLAG